MKAALLDMKQDTRRYQRAAQDARNARDELAGVDDQSIGVIVVIVVLGVIEGYLSDRHANDNGDDS
jgi:hypothetical protein